MFFDLLTTKPLFIIPWVVAVLVSIGWHEFSHALSGYWQGDDTAQRAGRLSLNPLVHIDWLGFALLMFFGFGWGKPTPFNPYNLRFKKWGSALVAVAGPLSNMLLVMIALILYRVFGFSALYWQGSSNLLEVFLLFMAELNIVLFVFNLIPIPPLDGSKVLYGFLAQRHQNIIFFLETHGIWLLLALIIFGQNILSRLMTFFFVLFYSGFGLI